VLLCHSVLVFSHCSRAITGPFAGFSPYPFDFAGSYKSQGAVPQAESPSLVRRYYVAVGQWCTISCATSCVIPCLYEWVSRVNGSCESRLEGREAAFQRVAGPAEVFNRIDRLSNIADPNWS
jgi:hypothetical protein